MSLSVTKRLDILQRDISRFNARVGQVADQLPNAPRRDPATLSKVRPLYNAADELKERAISIAKQLGLGGEKYFQGRGLAQATAGVEQILNQAWAASRTATQQTRVGRHAHSEMTTSSVVAGSADSAHKFEAVQGNHDLPNTRFVGRISRPAINTVADRLENVPAKVVELTDALGARGTLFTGNLTDQHGYRWLRGEMPRGLAENVYWDTVPGAGGEGKFAVSPHHELTGRSHQATSLVLHEYGHTVDSAIAAPRYRVASESSSFRRGAWREMRKREAPKQYFKQHANEWFSEAFARYTKSQQSSAALARWYPQTYAYMREKLGAAQFRR